MNPRHRRVRDGKLVSCVLYYHARDACGSAGHGRVAGMLVDPEHRRQGLAGQLMEELLAESKGVPVSLFSTSMGKGLYASLGFRQLDSYVTLFTPTHPFARRLGKALGLPRGGAGRKAASEAAWPGTTIAEARSLARAVGGRVTVTPSPMPADIKAVLGLDRRMFGGDRAQVLQSSFAEAEGGILAVLRDSSQGRVLGYGFSAEGGIWGRGLGPLVAEGGAEALAIVGALIAMPSLREQGLKMTVRLQQGSFVEGLRRMGFREPGAKSPLPGSSSNPSPGMVHPGGGEASGAAVRFPGERGLYFALHERGSG